VSRQGSSDRRVGGRPARPRPVQPGGRRTERRLYAKPRGGSTARRRSRRPCAAAPRSSPGPRAVAPPPSRRPREHDFLAPWDGGRQFNSERLESGSRRRIESTTWETLPRSPSLTEADAKPMPGSSDRLYFGRSSMGGSASRLAYKLSTIHKSRRAPTIGNSIGLQLHNLFRNYTRTIV
jgi:hypothetical protein